MMIARGRPAGAGGGPGRGQAVPDRCRQPQVGAVGHAGGLDRDHAGRVHEVLGLVAQDEALELSGEQEDADRGRLVTSRAGDPRGEAAE